MAKNHGALLEDEEGNKYMMYNKEQEQAFIDAKKVYVHHVDEKFKPIVKDGKKVVGLRGEEKFKVIGRFS